MKKTYTRTRPATELEKLKAAFPNFDDIELSMEIRDGKIMSLITEDPLLQAEMRSQGFTET